MVKISHISYNRVIFLSLLLFFTYSSLAQSVKVIDNKGTINTVLTVGDIKYSVLTNDHNGWFLLNGREINSISNTDLSATSKTRAIGLLGNNLPDATNRVLKHPSSTTQLIGSVGGTEQTTLVQDNLPPLTLNGNTTSSGEHTHNTTVPNLSYRTNKIIHWLNIDESYISAVAGHITISGGGHSHTVQVSGGGTSVPFNNYQPYLVVNTFIYLGK